MAQASGLLFCPQAGWKFALHLAALGLSAMAASGAILEDVVYQSCALSPTARVSIRNTDGRIFVFGANTSRLEIWAMRRAFTKERLDAINFAVTIAGEVATIETIYPPAPVASLFADRSGTVDYLILLPQTCTLAKVELANGEVLLEGLRGESLEARLDRGRMQLRNCFTAARVSLGQGKLDVFCGWWEPRAFSLAAEITEGNVNVAVPANATLHFDVATATGKIHDAFADGEQELRTLNQRRGGESAVEFLVRVKDGDITLRPAY